MSDQLQPAPNKANPDGGVDHGPRGSR
jgi:hypothetical protein